MRYLSFCFAILFCSLFHAPLQATHLIGGELSYSCFEGGGSGYYIDLTIYRDCSAETEFPIPAEVFLRPISDPNNAILVELPFDFSQVVSIPLNDDGICAETVPSICAEYFVYRELVIIPFSPGGYDLIYDDCCRNDGVVNVNDPTAVGSYYTTHIDMPGPNCTNNSPTFDELPPLLMCADAPFVFDYSATDVDGDSLVYNLCNPKVGEFETLPWANGFDEINQMGVNTQLSVNQQTGELYVLPAELGRFVIGVCVSEYRDGILLSEKIRDYQFSVVPCDVVFAELTNDVPVCFDLPVQLDATVFGASSFFWSPTEGLSDPLSLNPTVLNPNPDVSYVLYAENEMGCFNTDTVSFYYVSDFPIANPGTMPDGPVIADGCSNAEVSVQSMNAVPGPPDEAISYVLHNGSSTEIGEVLAINSTGNFTTEDGFFILGGVSYFVTAVAGPDLDGDGIVDAVIGCVNQSNGTEVVFGGLNIIVIEECIEATSELSITVSVAGGVPDSDPTAFYSLSGAVSVDLAAGEVANFNLGVLDGQVYSIAVTDNQGCSAVYESEAVDCLKDLSISLQSFEAERQGKKVRLQWTTATEFENDFFELQRSIDGSEFETLASINGAGTSIEENHYAYQDVAAPSQALYYRLVDVDYNGLRTYSKVAVVKPVIDEVIGTELYPNPFYDHLRLTFAGPSEEQRGLHIYDTAGRLVYKNLIQEATYIDLSFLSSGLYLVQLESTLGFESFSVLKQ